MMVISPYYGDSSISWFQWVVGTVHCSIPFHFTTSTWIHKPNLTKIHTALLWKIMIQPWSQFWTLSWAVMTCAKLCHDWFIRIMIKAEIIFMRFQLRAQWLLMAGAPGDNTKFKNTLVTNGFDQNIISHPSIICALDMIYVCDNASI